jgi:hypothetical protein
MIAHSIHRIERGGIVFVETTQERSLKVAIAQGQRAIAAQGTDPAVAELVGVVDVVRSALEAAQARLASAQAEQELPRVSVRAAWKNTAHPAYKGSDDAVGYFTPIVTELQSILAELEAA